ncbi:MAG: hypothetical protein WB443_00125 [Nitrososphaeraceae archaeon]
MRSIRSSSAPSHKPAHVKASGTVEKLPGRMLRLKEIEIHAKQIIIMAGMQVNP